MHTSAVYDRALQTQIHAYEVHDKTCTAWATLNTAGCWRARPEVFVLCEMLCPYALTRGTRARSLTAFFVFCSCFFSRGAGKEPKYANWDEGKDGPLPKTECLKDCVARFLPWFNSVTRTRAHPCPAEHLHSSV